MSNKLNAKKKNKYFKPWIIIKLSYAKSNIWFITFHPRLSIFNIEKKNKERKRWKNIVLCSLYVALWNFYKFSIT